MRSSRELEPTSTPFVASNDIPLNHEKIEACDIPGHVLAAETNNGASKTLGLGSVAKRNLLVASRTEYPIKMNEPLPAQEIQHVCSGSQ
ncbi:uncharacterized protein TrAFT101_000337 [Trichoderma asperellum]|uniref:uncharacterized protein n=1 Tax=Trichoderma asperellum TaxID=101201 RepID=UPI00332BCB3C|nr:hypothetical protein TrAFT101_000337 [Trichoderma asperellum]